MRTRTVFIVLQQGSVRKVMSSKQEAEDYINRINKYNTDIENKAAIDEWPVEFKED